jgi:hypothetical protein
MRKPHGVVVVVLATATLLGASPPPDGAAPQVASSWVFLGPDNHLKYQADPQGNRILDFSYAGYRGGGVALPVVAMTSTVSPTSGDSTPAIQAALDAASMLPPDADGHRGAVLLGPGTFQVNGTLNLRASGVVLRGSGSGTGGTVLNMTGGAPHLLFSVGGSGSRKTGASTTMTDAYVPSGAMSFNVASAASFHVGDSLLINRPVTQAWIHFMGMDTLTSAGAAQTWIAAGTEIQTDRTIAAIAGNQITLDAPLADSFDTMYLSPPGSTVTAYTFPGRISEVGIEHLQVVGAAVDVIISSPQFTGVEMNAVSDAWLEDVVFQDTQNTVTIDNSAKRITLDEVHVTHTVTHTGDRMADFGLSGTQIFVNKSSSDGTGEWPLVTQGEVSGPLVALNFSSTQAAGIGPHQRWAVGLLTDNAKLPNAPNNPDGGATGISYSDRGNHGSGQGWAMGWGVAWNVATPYLVVQQPPGAQNWCIGCVGSETTAVEAGSGKAVPNGVFESLGTNVTPQSLYLAQLCDRLGAAALVNIGYAATDCGGVTGGGGSGSGSGSASSSGSAGTTGGGDSGSPGGGSSSGPGSSAGSGSGAGAGSGSGAGAGSGSGAGAAPGNGSSSGNGGGASQATGSTMVTPTSGCNCSVPRRSTPAGEALLAMGACLALAARRRRGVSGPADERRPASFPPGARGRCACRAAARRPRGARCNPPTGVSRWGRRPRSTREKCASTADPASTRAACSSGRSRHRRPPCDTRSYCRDPPA